MNALERVRWAVATYGGGLKLACSLGAEDMVLAHMLSQVAPGARAFVLDTGRLHEETYQTLAQARRRLRLEFEVYHPRGEAVEKLLTERGPLSFRESVDERKRCCMIRKVEPLARALGDATAWMTGLRREQAVTRTSLEPVEFDADHGGIAKISPLYDWTEAQVWDYLRANQVPWNPLHDQGFPSIGCAPCTRAIAPGEDLRAGRWWWESPEHKECGLHLRVRG